MRVDPERAILTVSRQGDAWVVEHEGDRFGHSRDKEVAKASAHKRARELLSKGHGCEVRVYGENGYFGVR